jgi:hypothetical protein
MRNDFNIGVSRPPLQLWLARHGSNERDGVDPDAPLSEEGKLEIQRMVGFLRSQSLHFPLVIFTSHYKRNLQTASIVEEALAAKGPVEIFHCSAIADEPNRAVLATYSFLSGLDSRQIEGGGSAGSVMVIGNKRNMLLETLSFALDPAAALAEVSHDPSLIHSMDAAALEAMIMSDECGHLVDDSKQIEAYSKARLSGFELNIDRWNSLVTSAGRRFVDRSFTSHQEKTYILDLLKN